MEKKYDNHVEAMKKYLQDLMTELEKEGKTKEDIDSGLETIKFYENKLKEIESRKKSVVTDSPIQLSRKEFGKYDVYIKIWDMRDQYNPPIFKKVGKIIYPKKPINRSEDLARKNFYAAYRVIYGKEYRYKDVREAKKEVKKEHLSTTCEQCPQQNTCQDLCPVVIGYIEQDQVKGGRELSLGNIEYNNEEESNLENNLIEHSENEE